MSADNTFCYIRIELCTVTLGLRGVARFGSIAEINSFPRVLAIVIFGTSQITQIGIKSTLPRTIAFLEESHMLVEGERKKKQ